MAFETQSSFADSGTELLLRSEKQNSTAQRGWQETFAPKAHAIFAQRNLLRTQAQQASIADGCWDILLGLYLHDELTITDLKKLAGLPLTTALRWLEQLDDQDLVVRREKPGDRRAALIGIGEKGRKLVETMLATSEATEKASN